MKIIGPYLMWILKMYYFYNLSMFAVLLLAVTTLLSTQEAKFEIKSAIVTKEMVAMGQKVECTW